jgi:hypothetical protein
LFLVFSGLPLVVVIAARRQMIAEVFISNGGWMNLLDVDVQ